MHNAHITSLLRAWHGVIWYEMFFLRDLSRRSWNVVKRSSLILVLGENGTAIVACRLLEELFSC